MASLGTWPASILPKSCSPRLNFNQLANAAPGGGTEQVVDLLNDRWVFDLTLPPENFEDAAAVEAFLNSFRGMANTVDAWPFHRPEPRGTLRGSLYTVGTTAQFASSITLQAQRGRVNLIEFSEEIDNPVWTKSNVTVTPNAAVAPDGTTTADKLVATAAGSYVLQPFAVGTGPRTFMLDVKTSSVGTTLDLRILQNGSSTPAAISPFTTTGTWQTVSVTAADITGYPNPTAVIGGGSTFASPEELYVWGAQVSVSPTEDYQRITDASGYDVADYTQALTTLKAGDLIGVGGQLLMVAQDCTADSTGTIVVPIVNRVRAEIAAGSIVTWDRPTIAFRKLSDSGLMYRQGLTDEISLTLGEVIA